jgi:hypothetical protein
MVKNWSKIGQEFEWSETVKNIQNWSKIVEYWTKMVERCSKQVSKSEKLVKIDQNCKKTN